MLCCLTTLNPLLRKFLGWFSEKLIHNITNSDNLSRTRSSCQNPWGNTLICRLLQGFWLRTQWEDRPNTSSLWSPQRNCSCYNDAQKNAKVKVCSPDGDTDFFDIVAGLLLGDTLAPYLFIICLDYVLWKLIDLMKENGLTLERQEADNTYH